MTATRLLITEVLAANQVKGRLISGSLRTGDSVALAPSGQQTSILRLCGRDGSPIDQAAVGDEINVELTYSATARPGDLLAAADQRPEFSDQFEASLEWQSEEPLLPGRTYMLEAIGGRSEATISRLKYRLEDAQQLASATLANDQIGVCNLALTRAVVYDPFSLCPALGEFLLLDLETGITVAQGRIRHGLRRASNVHWQALDVDKQSRAAIKQQSPRIIWLTGLSGSGKSTIANLLEKKLIARARHSYLLDGDNVRHGLNKDLGFTDADRVENIRRVAETAKLMLDAGLIVITSFISPFRAEREMARTLFEEGEFIEVFVEASLQTCEQRDPKGLYRKARAGEIKNFTGLDSPYEAPLQPELTIDTEASTPEQAVDEIIAFLGLT